MNKMDEIIIVVPRKELFEDEIISFQGLVSEKDYIDTVFTNMANNFTTMRRGDAEENKAFKQPIPYGVIRRGNEIFTYKRLSGAGETRLHEKTSIGVGGHMNDIEEIQFFESLIIENLLREINEEIEISTEKFDLSVIGLINDDLDEVGEVHIGVLAIIDIPLTAEVKVKETEQLEGYFLKVEQLQQSKHFDSLENWSKIAVQILS